MATRTKLQDVDPDMATESLRALLSETGIVFPSLADDRASPQLGLVVLGSIRADVAIRLADVIRREGREREH
ncbi:hypothetical protein ACIBL6_23000 [Streptomyces sp. NPDC050400]|uniref:hypothetical protein n=1 Tax=Streptomyces sp. NPDC050400 TaxID=3365610 RepID=UPI0037BC5E07